jgi:hypothetical protein
MKIIKTASIYDRVAHRTNSVLVCDRTESDRQLGGARRYGVTEPSLAVFRPFLFAPNVRCCLGFSDAGARRCLDSLRLPASEKRQDTKSRDVEPRRFSGSMGIQDRR